MDPKEQIQLLADQLEGAVNQRNAAQNECIALNAQLKAALRRAEAAEAKLAEPAKANGMDAEPLPAA